MGEKDFKPTYIDFDNKPEKEDDIIIENPYDKPLDIEIINNIDKQIAKYRARTGATKTFISKKMGFNNVQSLDSLAKSSNPTIHNLIKLSFILNCDILDLVSYKVISK